MHRWLTWQQFCPCGELDNFIRLLKTGTILSAYPNPARDLSGST
ncbi:MAG: hypothetical protein U0T82_11435 [Bacteroidales bacterium]